MREELRQELEKVVHATINEQPSVAEEAFHNYIKAKTRDILGEACSEEMEEMEDKKGTNAKKSAKQDKDMSDDSSDDISDDDSSDDSSDDNECK